MAIEQIIQKILHDARAEAVVLEQELADKRKQQEQEHDKELKEYAAQLEQETIAIVSRTEEGYKSQKRRQEKTQKLTQVQNTIHAVLQDTYDYMISLKEEEYVATLNALLQKYNYKAGIYLVPEQWADVTKKLLPKGSKITVVNSIRGGFIYKGEECEIDNSFKTLLFHEWYNDLVLFIAQKITPTA